MSKQGSCTQKMFTPISKLKLYYVVKITLLCCRCCILAFQGVENCVWHILLRCDIFLKEQDNKNIDFKNSFSDNSQLELQVGATIVLE